MTLTGVESLPALPHRESTAEAAAGALRTQIALGRLPPGTRLREEQLATAFAISRNTVREAFRLLSRDRLVEHALHRGVFVRVVNEDDIRDVYRTRRLVEPLGVATASVGALRERVEHAEAAARRDDWDAVGTADIDFHREIVSACGSVHLSTMFERLLAELRLAFLGMGETRGLHEPFIARNRRLVDLIASGETVAVADELGDYFDSAERQLLDAMDR